jgi:hypothetical protein
MVIIALPVFLSIGDEHQKNEHGGRDQKYVSVPPVGAHLFGMRRQASRARSAPNALRYINMVEKPAIGPGLGCPPPREAA